jgi:hypothetical protein
MHETRQIIPGCAARTAGRTRIEPKIVGVFVEFTQGMVYNVHTAWTEKYLKKAKNVLANCMFWKDTLTNIVSLRNNLTCSQRSLLCLKYMRCLSLLFRE